MSELLDAARVLAPHLVDLRRDFHRHPEPGFGEHRTARCVEDELAAIGGWNVRRVAGTGVVADLGGDAIGGDAIGGDVVLLRADMDALELTEETGLPFASEVPGMMHACGHDAHTAILLGAARLIAERVLVARPAHRIRLIFQPCEETSPGGARAMIDAGVLENVRAAFALHVYPQEEVGTIAVRPGPMMANADDFDVIFHGRGGHAAQPHVTRDALVAAADFVSQVQKIVSRRVNPFSGVVVTIGRIEAGTRRNIIAGEARLEGTIRTLTPEQRAHGKELLERAAMAAASVVEVDYELRYIEGYPVVTNDPEATKYVCRVAGDMLGSDHVRLLAQPSMGGEDFAFIAERVPSCFFRLGSGGSDPETHHGHHSSRFRVDEDCLPIGAALMAAAALDWKRA